MRRLIPAVLLPLFLAAPLAAGSWPQFRGPQGTARPDTDHRLPARIGPDENVVWKVKLPPGHSSPVIHGDRIFLTAEREKRLFTLGLDRRTGKVLWETEAPYQQLEKIHRIGSHVQPSPATDGKLVVSFFGSCGLFCYDADGKRLWHLPMGPFKNEFGAGSSPLLVGDRVILGQDHDEGSFLMALDKQSGKVLWRVDRSEFPFSYASPVIWEVEGRKQVVVAGTLRVTGYDFDTGKEVWSVGGMARVMNMTPVVGTDGILYVGGWAAGADPGGRFAVPPFDDVIARQDADKNGTVEEKEMPEGPLVDRFSQIDRDKDGHITKAEWEAARRIFDAAQNRVIAVRPGGRGDVTTTHVLWSYGKSLPYVPSPLYLNGALFLVKDGGILTTLDPKTGQPIKQERLPGAAGNYYSSPVGGDGKVYLVSQRGDLTVVTAEPEWKVLSRARFGEEVYATPAPVDGQVFLRTAGHLYCFGEKP